MHEKALKEGFFIKNQNHTHISLRDLQAYRIDTVENKAHRHVAISLGTIYHNIPWAYRSDALRAFLSANPQNPTSYPLKTPQNRSCEFYGHESLCTGLTDGRFRPKKPI